MYQQGIITETGILPFGEKPEKRDVMLCKKVCLFGLVFIILCQSGCTPKDQSLIITRKTMEQEQETTEDELEEKPESVYLCVHVCGAVCRAGVYYLPEGSRVNDALLAAGGLSDEGDADYMNLALPVTDGEQIYFPTREEAALLKSADGMLQPGKVNINTANEAELCSLPGIGESRAKDIISYRKKNGRFASPEDIMKVPGIKQSVYDRISDCITVE